MKIKKSFFVPFVFFVVRLNKDSRRNTETLRQRPDLGQGQFLPAL